MALFGVHFVNKNIIFINQHQLNNLFIHIMTYFKTDFPLHTKVFLHFLITLIRKKWI